MKDKVLLVDDDAMVLAGLKRQLRNHFSIDTALSGEEALKRVQENDHDEDPREEGDQVSRVGTEIPPNPGFQPNDHP